jgi:hypothetical protein
MKLHFSHGVIDIDTDHDKIMDNEHSLVMLFADKSKNPFKGYHSGVASLSRVLLGKLLKEKYIEQLSHDGLYKVTIYKFTDKASQYDGIFGHKKKATEHKELYLVELFFDPEGRSGFVSTRFDVKAEGQTILTVSKSGVTYKEKVPKVWLDVVTHEYNESRVWASSFDMLDQALELLLKDFKERIDSKKKWVDEAEKFYKKQTGA